MIKSKKAKEIIEESKFRDTWGLDALYLSDVHKTVELAESELYSEEQCIEAFCLSTCKKQRKKCISHDGCKELNQFLSALKSLKQ